MDETVGSVNLHALKLKNKGGGIKGNGLNIHIWNGRQKNTAVIRR